MPDSSKRQSAHRQSLQIALCGIMTALSAALLLTGGIIPIATYAAPMLAGLLLLPVRLSCGRRQAWLCWLATALIVLVIGFDREAAFFYLFIGWYPAAKWDIDQKVPRRWQLPLKALLFAAAVAVMYALLLLVFPLPALGAEFRETGTAMIAALYAVMILCLLLYDRLIGPATLLYVHRIEPKLPKFR